MPITIKICNTHSFNKQYVFKELVNASKTFFPQTTRIRYILFQGFRPVNIFKLARQVYRCFDNIINCHIIISLPLFFSKNFGSRCQGVSQIWFAVKKGWKPLFYFIKRCSYRRRPMTVRCVFFFNIRSIFISHLVPLCSVRRCRQMLVARGVAYEFRAVIFAIIFVFR